MSQPSFIGKRAQRGNLCRKELEAMKARHTNVGAPRAGPAAGFEYTGGEVKDFLARLQAAGLLALRSGINVVRLAPPLIISEAEISKGVQIIEEALE